MSKNKPMPSLRSDEAAEQFVAESDLTAYDLSVFKPLRFEISRKEAALNLRIPSGLLAAVKAKAAARGVPYSRYVRSLLEADVALK